MKRKLSGLFMLFFVMTMAAFFAGSKDSVAAMSGDGKPETPFIIKTVEDLEEFRDKVNNYKGRTCSYCAELQNDLVLNDVRIKGLYKNDGSPCFIDSNDNIVTNVKKWTPIGNEDIQFNGYFNGNSHVIRGVYVDMPETNGVGFFGFICYPGQIINLHLSDSYIRGKAACGGIAGVLTTGKIAGCGIGNPAFSDKPSYVRGETVVGGICGLACDLAMTTGGDEIRGYLLKRKGQNMIFKDYSVAFVNAKSVVGGICGWGEYLGYSELQAFDQCIQSDEGTFAGKYFGKYTDENGSSVSKSSEGKSKKDVSKSIKEKIKKLKKNVPKDTKKNKKKMKSLAVNITATRLSGVPEPDEPIELNEQNEQNEQNDGKLAGSIIDGDRSSAAAWIVVGAGVGVIIIAILVLVVLKKRKA